jgi:hypothetical protein
MISRSWYAESRPTGHGFDANCEIVLGAHIPMCSWQSVQGVPAVGRAEKATINGRCGGWGQGGEGACPPEAGRSTTSSLATLALFQRDTGVGGSTAPDAETHDTLLQGQPVRIRVSFKYAIWTRRPTPLTPRRSGRYKAGDALYVGELRYRQAFRARVLFYELSDTPARRSC